MKRQGSTGANKWHQFKSITLPLLSPTTFYALIITIINSFQVFDQIWIMTSGEPTADLVPVMVTEIYKNSFQYPEDGICNRTVMDPVFDHHRSDHIPEYNAEKMGSL